MLARILPSFVLPAAAVLGQHLCLAEGNPTDLDIVTVAEANLGGGDTVVLQHVELLAIEITGRTIARDGDAQRSRRAVVGGIERVELPGGGRLFHYRRQSGQFYGYLHVAADGTTRVALELAATGTTLDNPFGDQIAVADDGLHAAIAGAGGGLFVMRLDGGVFASTGRPDRVAAPVNLDVAPSSVMVGPTHAFFTGGTDQLFRCALADGGAPVDVSPPVIAGAFWKPELAMAGDGLSVVGLYGPHNTQMRLYLCDVNGSAAALPPSPSKYEEPNYLPLGAGGPSLLLNDDGTRLFYVDGRIRDELFLLDTAGALPSLQITEDQIFEPYIGVYILPKFRGPQLLAAIGDLGQMDWYSANLTAAGGAVANLTNTGTPTQPYFPGTLDPLQAADSATSRVVVERLGAGMLARRFDLQTGLNTVVRQDATLATGLGSAFVGTPDLVVRGPAGEGLFLGASGALLGATPAGIGLTMPVRGPLFAATRVTLTPTLGITAYYVGPGAIIPGVLELGVQQLVMTAAGGILTNSGSLHYVAIGVDVVLPRPPVAFRWCLSGAGG